jgi:hypothetical protein
MGNLSVAGPSVFLNYKVDNVESLVTKLIEKREWKLLLKLIQDNPSEATKKDKSHGRLPIHRALIHGAPIQLVETLIKLYPAALQTGDNLDNYPIYYSIVNNANYPIFFLLLSYNTECLKKGDKDGHLPLHNAIARKMNENTLLLFINTYPESALKRTRLGKHSLHYACEFNASASVVKTILSVNPDEISGNNKLGSKHNSNQNLATILTADDEPNSNTDLAVSPHSSAIRTATDNLTPTRSVASPTGSNTDFQQRETDCEERTELSPSTTTLNNEHIASTSPMSPFATATSQSSDNNITSNNNTPANNSKVDTLKAYTNSLACDFHQSKLPIHIACEYKASLGVVNLLIEAYPEGVSVMGEWC